MDDNSDSDCIISNVVSSEECNIDRLPKRPKIETDEDFSFTKKFESIDKLWRIHKINNM